MVHSTAIMHLTNVFHALLLLTPSCAHSGQTIPFSLFHMADLPAASLFVVSVEPCRFSSLEGLSVEAAINAGLISRIGNGENDVCCML